MKYQFKEMKIGHIVVTSSLFKKLKRGNLIFNDTKKDHIIIRVNKRYINEVINRRAQPEPLKNEDGSAFSLLGLPVAFSEFTEPNEIFHDAEVSEFCLQAQFDDYDIIFVNSEEKVDE